jgi:hypothetical protein
LMVTWYFNTVPGRVVLRHALADRRVLQPPP